MTEREKCKERKQSKAVWEIHDGGRCRECREECEVSQDKCCLSSAVVCGKLFVHTQRKNSKNKSQKVQKTIHNLPHNTRENNMI